MKSFNEYFVKPSPIYRELSGFTVKRLEMISAAIDGIREYSDLHQASLRWKNGELTIKLVIDFITSWKDEPGLFNLIGLVDQLKVYSNNQLGPDGIIIVEMKIREMN